MQTIAVLCKDEIQEDRPTFSLNHARVSQKMGVLLSQHSEHVDVLQQLSLNLDGMKSIPDISIFKVGTLKDEATGVSIDVAAVFSR